MKLTSPSAEIFIPDNLPTDQALGRITHLGIGAHQDDLEFMAFHGITECFYSDQHWFGGITCTDGAGSSRTGKYAGYDDARMQATRIREQNTAAIIGRYGIMIQLKHPSSSIKKPGGGPLTEDLIEILTRCQPEVIYTHNLADKHETHIAVVLPVLKAIRSLPSARRPKHVYGCEVWRNLDWMMDTDKVAQDVSGHDPLAQSLNSVFDSQIAGGKRYDLATLGRRRANATFFDSHASDKADQVIFSMDLTPLIKDPTLDITDYTITFIDRFRQDVNDKIKKLL